MGAALQITHNKIHTHRKIYLLNGSEKQQTVTNKWSHDEVFIETI
jgi:hypothetical protein